MQLCGSEVFGLVGFGKVSYTHQQNDQRHVRLISGGLCKVSLEQLLVFLRPYECINYVEQSLVLTLTFLFMVEVH